VRAFWFAAIQAFTPADVLPPAAAANVCVHEPGGPTGEPAGVCGFGMSPSPSAGVFPAGSIGNALAVTGGTGWVTAGAAAGALAGAAAVSAVTKAAAAAIHASVLRFIDLTPVSP
jgi:hypothetical protein